MRLSRLVLEIPLPESLGPGWFLQLRFFSLSLMATFVEKFCALMRLLLCFDDL